MFSSFSYWEDCEIKTLQFRHCFCRNIANSFSRNNGRIWIGLRRTNDVWRWVNGDIATNEQIFWIPGQPDNKDEDCGEMIFSSQRNGRANNSQCRSTRQAWCEIPT